jgi:hypothetical protein
MATAAGVPVAGDDNALTAVPRADISIPTCARAPASAAALRAIWRLRARSVFLEEFT